jgi:Zn-dependent peptidase ImmA (M78 family)
VIVWHDGFLSIVFQYDVRGGFRVSAFSRFPGWNWGQELEEEANWLAGALLVSDEAAIAVARSKMSIENAARKYGVSSKMMRFRLNVSGAHARVQRARW